MKRLVLILTAAAALTMAVPTVSPAAEPAPAFSVTSLATPTNFSPGDTEGRHYYDVRVENLGAAPTDGTPITVVDTLPAGLELDGSPELRMRYQPTGSPFPKEKDFGAEFCSSEKPAASVLVTCTIPSSTPGNQLNPAVLQPSEELRLVIDVDTPGSIAEGTPLLNAVEVEGGGAPPVSIDNTNEASSTPAKSGFSYFKASVVGLDGQLAGEAGSHPYQYVTSYGLNLEPAPKGSVAAYVPAGGDTKDISVALPPGLVGSATALPQCSRQDFDTTISLAPPGGGFEPRPDCPDNTAIGLVALKNFDGQSSLLPQPIYNLAPPPGMPAQFGFTFANLPFYINAEVRNGTDYGVDGVLRNLSQVKRVTGATVTIWGVPGAERHDPIRGACLMSIVPENPYSRGECEAGFEPRWLLRLPSSCEEPLDLSIGLNTWTTPGSFITQTSPGPVPSGCDQLGFEPSLRARPTTDVADSPTGLEANVHLPQEEDPEALSSADLRTAVVTLPEGLVVNPSGANGLDACSPGQIGLTSASGEQPVTFTPGPSQCPDAARIGTAEVETPLLDHPLKGGVFVATPHDNPFDSLLALYIAIDDAQSGINLKLAGEVEADPQTGRLTTTFAEAPQQPFEDFRLDFFGGPAAALRTPAACGPYQSTSVLTPYSAPASGPPATPADSYAIARSPLGGDCPTAPAALPFSPAFAAGTVSPVARAYTPFVLNLSRADGSQELSSLEASPPAGLIAKLAGVPYCPEAAIAAAAARSGRDEEAQPSCPAASRVGSVSAGAGAGPAPYYAHGTAYLAGPYKGAPLSLAIVTPAAAGPYDLGTIVVRAALYVDPATARVRAVSDPIPRILQGIPLDVRSVSVSLDRPEFMLNPSDCDPMQIDGQALSVLGAGATLASRFQLGECGRLAFKPKLRLKLKGPTLRDKNPRLIATLKAKPGEAGFRKAAVTLPRAAFLDQDHIRTVCTRVQWAADACPKGSVYGRVEARTPLLDYALKGKVYLRSNPAEELPDLVADLRGPAYQPVRFELAGQTDSVKGALRNTFKVLPDAPVSSFRLELFGGKRGLVVNSRNLCAKAYRTSIELEAQNGKTYDTRPRLGTDCKKKKGKKGRKRGGRRG